jgi:DNA-directed RNA polymerase specialized sigma24 family protein
MRLAVQQNQNIGGKMQDDKRQKKQKMKKKHQKLLENNLPVIKNALRGHQITEDKLQEIYLRLCSKMSKFDQHQSKITTFLHLHSKWSFLDHLAVGGSKIPFIGLPQDWDTHSREPDPLDAIIQKEQEDIVQAAIDELPLVAKVILQYWIFHDGNIQKTSNELEITRNITIQQLKLAFDYLSEKLKAYNDA